MDDFIKLGLHIDIHSTNINIHILLGINMMMFDFVPLISDTSLENLEPKNVHLHRIKTFEWMETYDTDGDSWHISGHTKIFILIMSMSMWMSYGHFHSALTNSKRISRSVAIAWHDFYAWWFSVSFFECRWETTNLFRKWEHTPLQWFSFLLLMFPIRIYPYELISAFCAVKSILFFFVCVCVFAFGNIPYSIDTSFRHLAITLM